MFRGDRRTRESPHLGEHREERSHLAAPFERPTGDACLCRLRDRDEPDLGPSETPEDGVLRYRVSGQLFFASADLFAASFEYHGHPKRVEIDMTDAHLWDLTGVAAVDKVVFRYRRQGAEVELIGMNQAGQTLVDQVGKHDKSHLPAGEAAH